MSQTRFVLLVLALLAGQCIGGGRQFIKTELRNSPFGVGIHSALSESRQFSSWRRRHDEQEESRTSAALCSEHSDQPSRFASMLGSEREALGLAMTPHLKPKPRKYSRDELDYLEEEIVTCSSRTHRHRARVSAVEPQHVINAVRRDPALKTSRGPKTAIQTSDTRGGNALVAVRPLLFWENMVSGAVSRSIAQTVMHPANTMKTILQSARGADRPTIRQLMKPEMFKTLTRGAGANFILSVPHGAVNFAVLDLVRSRLNSFVESVPFLAERADSMGAGLDFVSSAISTICCSVVSTPQMMITDNIMAGNYPRLDAAITGLYAERGILGFYSGWWPGLVGKIPSYALTWTFFQQLKRVRDFMSEESATNVENTIMGCVASGTTVCIMIPLDTIKTRLVTQLSSTAATGVPYKGIVDCAIRITQEEGIKTFYRGLAPRLISVVPMIGIQFGVYEAMKRFMLEKNTKVTSGTGDPYGKDESLEETVMEVAADPSNPFPAPHILKHIQEKKKKFSMFGGKRRADATR